MHNVFSIKETQGIWASGSTWKLFPEKSWQEFENYSQSNLPAVSTYILYVYIYAHPITLSFVLRGPWMWASVWYWCVGVLYKLALWHSICVQVIIVNRPYTVTKITTISVGSTSLTVNNTNCASGWNVLPQRFLLYRAMGTCGRQIEVWGMWFYPGEGKEIYHDH